ncbi:MAG TPA: hypothetical protein VNQ32_08385 [Steroidobacteraceae bacterium]|nr:hypothetical protein [Steroidobacteraceae bacterium]
MEALKILRMPFQLGSLLFVAASSLLLGVILGGGYFPMIMGLAALWIILVALTNYAFRMISDIANGVREASTAEVEMMNPVADSRSWVHPLVAVALVALHATQPGLSVVPTVVAAVLLFPPSIAACAMSGRAADALNPRAIFEVIRGMGPWYPLAVLSTVFWAGLGALAVQLIGPGWLYYAVLQLLLLLAYASIGGVVYQRRIELGFAARISPERRAETAAHERERRRQQLFDHLYESLRARDAPRAIDAATLWLREADGYQFAIDTQALLAAGRQWNEPQQFARLLLGLLPLLLARGQPSLALAAADTLRASGGRFVPAEETTAVTLADYALQTGRRRAAQGMLEDFLSSPAGAGPPGPRLASLCATLGVVPKSSA